MGNLRPLEKNRMAQPKGRTKDVSQIPIIIERDCGAGRNKRYRPMPPAAIRRKRKSSKSGSRCRRRSTI